ncbi:hypothetical protein D3C86_1117170 [compost metagenome]
MHHGKYQDSIESQEIPCEPTLLTKRLMVKVKISLSEQEQQWARNFMNDDHKFDAAAQRAFDTNRKVSICRDAAILVVQHQVSRDAAIKEASEILAAQQRAMDDVTGTAELLSDAQSPTMPADLKKQKQVQAIEIKLFDEFERYER